MKNLIRFDWAAKKILRNKANFDILEGFLSELLKYDVSIVELLESESNQDDKIDKFNRVDLLVKNHLGELIIVEIQNDRELDYFQRMLYGTSRLITDHMALGKPYSQVKKVISVHIVYFDLGQGEDYLYYGSTRFVGLHTHDELRLSDSQQKAFHKSGLAKDIFPEYYLIKVEKFNDLITDRFDEWVYFLKHEEIKEEFQARNIRQAKEKLDVLKLNEEERKKYNSYLENLRYQASMFWSSREEGRQEGHQEGHQEGLEKGLEKGRQEGRLTTARETLLTVLEEKFGSVPDTLRTRIQNTQDEETLKTWLRQAINAESIEF